MFYSDGTLGMTRGGGDVAYVVRPEPIDRDASDQNVELNGGSSHFGTVLN